MHFMLYLRRNIRSVKIGNVNNPALYGNLYLVPDQDFLRLCCHKK